MKSVVRAVSPKSPRIEPEEVVPRKRKNEGDIANKTGGAYIPPAKLRMMQKAITDKSSEQYQKLSWEALKKSLNGLINKVNVSNIIEIVKELLQENLVRGRGLLARSILSAQNLSPTFTHVYAALVSIINTRFPQNGQLILTRLANNFKKNHMRNNKEDCLHACQFIAHLLNHQVCNEALVLQILLILLESPTDSSVEIAIGLLKECGQKLSEISPRALSGIFDQLKNILHEQSLHSRTQYMIEVMFAIRKDGFKEHPVMMSELDHVSESDQITHDVQLTEIEMSELEMGLNVFKFDPDYLESEESYKKIKAEILDESDDDSSSGESGSDDDSSSEESGAEEEAEAKKMEILDMTETNMVALRRTIYLSIQSSITFEECTHKILKMEFGENDFPEIFAMILDCCSQKRTYEKFFGLLAQRFCDLKREYMVEFEKLFAQQYEIIHRYETNKLRNIAKLFGHLLHSDSIPWSVFANVNLTEDTTTSSGRIFLKILLLEITEYMGVEKLNERFNDPSLQSFFEGVFPRDNPKSTRFAINFLTTIGLGTLTEGLREHLKQSDKQLQLKLQQEQLKALAAEQSSSDDSSSDDDSSSSSSSSEDDRKRKRKTKRSNKKKNKKSSKKQSKKRKSKKNKKVSSSSSSSSSSSEDSSDEEEKKPTVVRLLEPYHQKRKEEEKQKRQEERQRRHQEKQQKQGSVSPQQQQRDNRRRHQDERADKHHGDHNNNRMENSRRRRHHEEVENEEQQPERSSRREDGERDERRNHRRRDGNNEVTTIRKSRGSAERRDNDPARKEDGRQGDRRRRGRRDDDAEDDERTSRKRRESPGAAAGDDVTNVGRRVRHASGDDVTSSRNKRDNSMDMWKNNENDASDRKDRRRERGGGEDSVFVKRGRRHDDDDENEKDWEHDVTRRHRRHRGDKEVEEQKENPKRSKRRRQVDDDDEEENVKDHGRDVTRRQRRDRDDEEVEQREEELQRSKRRRRDSPDEATKRRHRRNSDDEDKDSVVEAEEPRRRRKGDSSSEEESVEVIKERRGEKKQNRHKNDEERHRRSRQHTRNGGGDDDDHRSGDRSRRRRNVDDENRSSRRERRRS